MGEKKAVTEFDVEKKLGETPLSAGDMEQTYADFYSGRGGLKFVPPLEVRFQNMFLPRDWRYIRFLHSALLALYVVYGVFDYMVLGDSVYEVWAIRYLVALPLLSMLFFVGRAEIFSRFLQTYISVTMVLLILTTLWMISVSPVEVANLYMTSLLAMVMAGLTISRMRFWYVVTVSIIFLVSSVVMLMPIYQQWPALTYFLMLDAGSVLFCSVGAYAYEHSLRREFLQHTLIQQKNRQLAEANESLKNLADVDALTGIYNRRYLDNVMDEEWRRARRRGYPLALLMCDIDFFKAYNDSQGHVQGDQCIRAVAQCLKNMFNRPGDLVARYGGEEFAIFLPELSLEDAYDLAKNVCERIQALGIKHPASKVGPVVTLSVGVGEYCPSMGRDPNVDRGSDADNEIRDLVRMADYALYKAKKSGRNRAETFTGVLPLLDAV